MSQSEARATAGGVGRIVARVRRVPAIGTLLSRLGVSHLYDYHRWFLRQRATPRELADQRAHTFAYAPLLSFVVPVYNPPPAALRALLDAVLAQTYAHWDLCMANGDPSNTSVRSLLDQYAGRDERIHVRHLSENLGIAGNTNAALELATGEYVALVDHDDLIEPSYAHEVVAALNLFGPADLVYFDQDKVSADGKLFTSPELKPAWSPDLLLTSPLPIHPVIKRSRVIDLGGFDAAADGTQDWDLFLRLAERTSAAIHIPRVLYHWRTVAASAATTTEAKPYVYERQLAAITRHLSRLGRAGASAQFEGQGYSVVRASWQTAGAPATLIIPVFDAGQRLLADIASLRAKAGYERFDILLVDGGSAQRETDYVLAEIARQPGVRVLGGERPLSLWAAQNLGAGHATGDILVFLDANLAATGDGWLAELARWAALPEVGVVGARVLDDAGKIAHAGLVFGAGGLVVSPFAGCAPSEHGPFGSAAWYRDYSAVGGGCQAMRREVFTRLGGFDEAFVASYADADLCLRAGEQGLRVVYTPFASLIRHGSPSYATKATTRHDDARAQRQFAAMLERGDPAYNPHLALTSGTPRLGGARRSHSPATMPDPATGSLSPFAPRVPLWVMAQARAMRALVGE